MTTTTSEVRAAAEWVVAQMKQELALSRAAGTTTARALHEGQAAGLASGLNRAKLDPGKGHRVAELVDPLMSYRGTAALRAMEGFRIGTAVALAVVQFAQGGEAE